MKRVAGLLLILVLCFSMTGCIAVAAGAIGAYSGSKKREVREKFLAEIRSENLEREKAGLKPLDLCTEMYRFDRDWARKYPDCKERIKAFEAGDRSALAVDTQTPVSLPSNDIGSATQAEREKP